MSMGEGQRIFMDIFFGEGYELDRGGGGGVDVERKEEGGI